MLCAGQQERTTATTTTHELYAFLLLFIYMATLDVPWVEFLASVKPLNPQNGEQCNNNLE